MSVTLKGLQENTGVVESRLNVLRSGNWLLALELLSTFWV